MRKIHLLLITIICLSFSTKGQNIPLKIKKSAIFKDNVKQSQIVLLEQDDSDGAYIVRSYDGNGISPKTGYYFEHYDKNLKLLKKEQLKTNAPVYQKNKTIIGLYYQENNIYLADILFDLKENAYISTMTIVSTKDFKTTQKELFRITKEEIKKLGLFTITPPYKFNEYDKINENVDKNNTIKMSVNKNKSAFSILLDVNSENSETFRLFLFDNNLDLKFDKIYQKNIKDSNYELQNFEVSNEGNSIFILGKIYPDDLKNEDVKHKFELTKITKDSENHKTLDIDQNILKAVKTTSQEDKIITIGFFKDKLDKIYKGIYYFEFDSNNLELKSNKINKFSDQFITDMYGELKSNEVKDLIFKKIIVSDDKSIIINAEESYTQNNPSNLNFGNVGSVGNFGGIKAGGQTYYSFNDIVSIKLDEKGNLIWSKNINKKQSETLQNISFISHTATYLKDDIFFFINANDKIKNLENNRIEFKDIRKNKLNLYLIHLNINGNFDYQKILDEEENEVPFMVANGIQSGNSVFFLGMKGPNKQLLKISF